MANWIVKKEGEEQGPFNDHQLISLATLGKIDPETHVRQEGRNTWKEARHVKGLYPDTTTGSEEDRAVLGNKKSSIQIVSRIPDYLMSICAIIHADPEILIKSIVCAVVFGIPLGLGWAIIFDYSILRTVVVLMLLAGILFFVRATASKK